MKKLTLMQTEVAVQQLYSFIKYYREILMDNFSVKTKQLLQFNNHQRLFSNIQAIITPNQSIRTIFYANSKQSYFAYFYFLFLLKYLSIFPQSYLISKKIIRSNSKYLERMLVFSNNNKKEDLIKMGLSVSQSKAIKIQYRKKMQSQVVQHVISKENYQFQKNQFSATFPQNTVPKSGQENIKNVVKNNHCQSDDNQYVKSSTKQINFDEIQSEFQLSSIRSQNSINKSNKLQAKSVQNEIDQVTVQIKISQRDINSRNDGPNKLKNLSPLQFSNKFKDIAHDINQFKNKSDNLKEVKVFRSNIRNYIRS